MDKKLPLAIVAALGLATAACTTTGGASEESDTASTSTSSTQGTAGSTSDSSTASSGESATTYGTESATASSDPGATSGDTDLGATSGATGTGETGPTGAVAGQEILGRQVVTEDGEPLGTVVQMVVDTNSQPAYVVISTGAEAAVVPHSIVMAMVQGDQIVMDRARLEGAPKVQGDLRAETSDAWRSAADAYWSEQSPMRTASPETGETESDESSTR